MECSPDWFDGDQDACQIYDMLVTLAHTWDDLVDRDKPVSETRVNRAFLIALAYLPSNPLYDKLRHVFAPFWVSIVSAYETANQYERDHDQRGLEIGHTLRYAAGHMIAYLVHYCVGEEKAREVMPEVWKAIVAERFEDYYKEHTP